MTFKKVFSDLEKLILKADHASLEGEFAFQCCVTGDGEGTFYIAFKDGVLDVQPYDYKNHTAVFKADADTYKRVLSGEMSAAEAVEKGLLSVENNESGCADILTFLSAKGTTKKTAAAKKPAAKTTAAAKKPAAKAAVKAEAKPAVKAEAKPAAKAAVKAEPKEEAPAKKTAGRKAASAPAKKPAGRKGTK